MAGQGQGAAALERLCERLSRWRAERGGPGIPLPKEIWSQAVEVARTHGVSAVARALRVDRDRLAARIACSNGDAPEGDGPAFVEVDTTPLCSTTKTVVRLDSSEGDRLELELGGMAALDVIALARAFWNRRG